MFRVELFRNASPKLQENEKHRRTDLNDTQQKIVQLLVEDNHLSAAKIEEEIDAARRNVENNIKKLKEYGILIRHGSSQSFSYIHPLSKVDIFLSFETEPKKILRFNFLIHAIKRASHALYK